jgi:zinc ribbon protein
MPSSTCSNCQAEVAAGATSCPSCGASVGSSGGSAAVKFDMASLTQTDRIVGIASAVLFISLFLPWFSVSAGAFGGSASALSAHGYMYLPLILSLVVVGLIGAGAMNLWKVPDTSPLHRDQILLIATGINVVLAVIAFVFKPSGLGVVNVGWSFGAFVGLIAAVVAVVPLARPAIKARQGR